MLLMSLKFLSDYTLTFPFPLRKTKRRITQEIVEHDEANPDGTPEEMKPEWSMLGDDGDQGSPFLTL